MFETTLLKSKTLAELQEIAKALGLKKISQLKKQELIDRLVEEQNTAAPSEAPKEEAPKKEQKIEAVKEEETPKPKRKRTVKKVEKTKVKRRNIF